MIVTIDQFKKMLESCNMSVMTVSEMIRGFKHHSVSLGDGGDVVIRFNDITTMDECQKHLNDDLMVGTYVDDTNASLTIKAIELKK